MLNFKLNSKPSVFGLLFSFFAFLFSIFSACSTGQTVSDAALPDGLEVDAPDSDYEIINLPLEKRKDVIKVKGTNTNWAIVAYSLADYKGKEITIQFSADVKREGAGGTLNWQVNNTPDYPSVAYLENASVGTWHSMRGRRVITPIADNPYFYLTNWENNAKNTVYYIDNFTITIEEGNSINPDLTLPPLKTTYKNDFLIGNISDNVYLSGKYFDLLKHHYNIVTSTATYPIMLAPAEKTGAYQWAGADAMLDLMESNTIPVHGHVLTWHEASPAWLTTGTKAEVEQNLKDHITTVLKHFNGRIPSWDVVNEAMKDGISASEAAGDWKKCVRTSENPWYDKLGADYIEIAFRAARAADPNITLYYNEYFFMDNFYSWDTPASALNKVDAVIKMINDINARYKNETGGARNLIEGIGIQSHHYGFGLNPNSMRSCLEKFKTLGIEMAISELDVSALGYVRGTGSDTVMSEKDELHQAILYAKLFKLYREYAPYIKRVTWWGMDDGTNWLSAGNPCLFDWKLTAKKAFYAVSDPDAFLAQNGE